MTTPTPAEAAEILRNALRDAGCPDGATIHPSSGRWIALRMGASALEELPKLRAEVEAQKKGRLIEDRLKMEALAELDEANARIRALEAGLRKLANEAEGFLSMADAGTHGNTNIRVMEHHISGARALLETSAAKAEASTETSGGGR